IGRRLLLSEATVKSHLVHIYDKLGVRSRTSAVAIAREQGVL
ncbi:response regulator transcription factor, partial [Corynebacterium belfantii]